MDSVLSSPAGSFQRGASREVRARCRKLSRGVPSGGWQEQAVLRSSVLGHGLHRLLARASGTVPPLDVTRSPGEGASFLWLGNDGKERGRGVSELGSLLPGRISFSNARVSVSSFSPVLVLRLRNSPPVNSHQCILREEDVETRAWVSRIPTDVESLE